VLCADTDEEAERLASSGIMAFTLLRRGQLVTVPPVEKAIRFIEEERGQKTPGVFPVQSDRRRILGSPGHVREGIEAAVREYGADEAMIVTITYDHEARLRSYELIARAFGLTS
jgi:alkanesulfonate monooxygenase SsuD/methylene tetrahydromethanopterin reductase-like flavin-dependent oxidoreductase (luciferase family)